MSRLHTGKKGRHGSHRPARKEAPKWVPLSQKEVEETVVKLSKEGKSASMIGMILRDQYGIPDVKLVTGKSIVKILTENGIKFRLPEDLESLMKRTVQLSKHLGSNPKDLHNKRGLALIESNIKRLANYYKKEGILPKDWAYSLDAAKLLVE
ncbi:MAG: 30S ribosomal protein S15 [Candidatus Thermoplasmatota archaeon]|nr:30S ribosomal protein S15 [Candidatus Thermoplasmatota archaeon]